MRYYLIFCLGILMLSCQNNTITSIDFDSREYEFNSEISTVLEQSGEMGFTARAYSFVSEHKRLLKTLEYGDSIKPPLSDSLWNQIKIDFKEVNATDYILKEAKNYDIIMFNENHYLPKHRNFVTSILSELYDQGYRILALESLGMMGDGTVFDKELNERGYPIKNSGFYIREPEFSMMIRKAIELGFHIIGYDEGSGYGYDGGMREVRGADNIIRQIKDDNLSGKLIVHCGWDHIKEGESGTYWEYALAERLKQATQQDVFTINQTEYNERLDRRYEAPLMQRIDHEESIVLIDEHGESINFSKNKDWYDVFLIHPRTKFENGIPDWIQREGKVEMIDLPKLEISFPCKVFVFDKDDDVLIASPIYVTEAESNNSQLLIPTRGKEIKIVLTNKNESILIT